MSFRRLWGRRRRMHAVFGLLLVGWMGAAMGQGVEMEAYLAMDPPQAHRTEVSALLERTRGLVLAETVVASR